jgi:hypothetical protein
MLQLRPTLTASEARAVLTSTAIADGFTGATPNADWGSGKLGLLVAMDALQLRTRPAKYATNDGRRGAERIRHASPCSSTSLGSGT